MQLIQEFFVNNFNSPMVATMFIAMLPIFELKGAIPFAMSSQFWGDKALNYGSAFLISFVFSSLIVPLIAIFYKPIISYLKNTKLFKNLSLKLDNKLKVKSEKISQKNSRLKKFFGILLFVAIPLPLTGVYTGTAISVIVGQKFSDTVLSVTMGNLIAGVIITTLSSISENSSFIILVLFLTILVLTVLIVFIKQLLKRIRNRKNLIG